MGMGVRLFLLPVMLASLTGLCNVPVFRYALERWPASPYEAVLFLKGPPPPEIEAFLREIESSAVNLVVERVDPEGSMDGALLKLWNKQKNPSLPWMVVRFPMSPESAPAAWAGPPRIETLRALIDSPVRQEILRRLIRGDSAVWLLIECGDREQDEAAEKLLGTQLAELERTLRLPETDPEEMPLLSNIPLKIAFSVLRVSRGDPGEKEFLEMLAQAGGDLAEGKRPVVLPVFGRGRALWPLSGERLCAEDIIETAEFIAGPCSCQVKEMNPGLDLLIRADWEALLSAAPADASSGVGEGTVNPPAPEPGSARSTSRALWIALVVLGGIVLLVGGGLLRRGTVSSRGTPGS